MEDDVSEALMSLLTQGMRVLDLGCGDGRFLDAVARLVGPSGVVVGLDPSAEALATARRRTALNRNAGVDWADLRYGLSVTPESFDAVLIHDPVASGAGPSALIPGAVRALQPGGVIGIVAEEEVERWRAGLSAEGVEITEMRRSSIEKGMNLVTITGVKKEIDTP